MQPGNKFLDDMSKLMTNAMGVAQGAKTEAETAMKSLIDRWMADRDFVTREEFDAVRAMAQRIRTSLSEPLMVDGRQIRVGASIGMACYPQDGETPEALLAAADQMMYEVKRGQQAASAL